MFKKLINSIRNPDIKEIVTLSLVIFAIFGAGGSYYFYSKYSAIKANPTLQAQKETGAMILAVGKLIELPKDETPTVATISDKEKLSNQPFFKLAENGDILLAYTTAQQAILYRPKTNKIINVAPISINQPKNPTQTTTRETPSPTPLRIAYYNGTKTAGVAALTEKKVKSKYPDSQTVILSNSLKNDYKETLVINLSGKHSQEISDLAQFLNAKIGTLPQGETAPDADILIISGN